MKRILLTLFLIAAASAKQEEIIQASPNTTDFFIKGQ